MKVPSALMCAALVLLPSIAQADFPPYTKVIGIAVLAPLSGPERQYGLDLSAGVQQAVDEANAMRGIADFGWAMRSFDDQADPGIAQQEAQFALVDDSTSFVIGHLGAQETSLALPIYHQREIPVIIPTAPLARLTQAGYDNVFRLCPPDVIEGQQDARYAERTMKAKKVAVVYEENDYGADTAQGFMNYATSGKVMAAKDFGVDVELKNAKSIVQNVKAYRPDLVFVSGSGGDMIGVAIALQEAGVKAPLLATQSFFSEDVIKKLKNQSALTVSSCVPPIERIPEAQPFVRRFEAAHGRMSSFALFGYVAAQIAIDAARQAHSSDRRTLDRQLSIGSFATVTGRVSFQRNGDPAQPNFYFYSQADGKFRFIDSAYPSASLAR